MTALLGPRTFIGFDEVYRFMTSGNENVEVANRLVIADLINAACLAIEKYIRGPVIYDQFGEYYYGDGTFADDAPLGPDRMPQSDHLNADARLWLMHRPLIEDMTHTFGVRVREQGQALDQSGSGWVDWVEGTDFIVNLNKALLTVNPAIHTIWPQGFRNIYVSYWAGYGAQVKDSELEIITSTVPEDIKLAGKKLVQQWYQNGVVQFGTQFMDASRFQIDTSGTLPDIVTTLMQHYINKRPMSWILT